MIKWQIGIMDQGIVDVLRSGRGRARRKGLGMACWDDPQMGEYRACH